MVYKTWAMPKQITPHSPCSMSIQGLTVTVAPFTFGKIDPVEDYDDVIDRLNTWLEKVTPLYLSSPEHKALSKANQKGKGE